ncbi:MAG: spermidine synthase [Dehalococcoidia bacterium]
MADDLGRRVLLVGGVVQSVDLHDAEVGDYWPAMLPDLRPSRSLLLGAGGGTLAALLLRRFGPLPIVAVDDNPRVVALGRAEMYLGLPEVQVVLADAFSFVESCPAWFDYVAVDLFRGAERPRAVLGKPFLRGLRRLTAPGGVLAFNLFRDRRVESTVGRIGRVLSVVRQVQAGKNVVVHCRVR